MVDPTGTWCRFLVAVTCVRGLPLVFKMVPTWLDLTIHLLYVFIFIMPVVINDH